MEANENGGDEAESTKRLMSYHLISFLRAVVFSSGNGTGGMRCMLKHYSLPLEAPSIAYSNYRNPIGLRMRGWLWHLGRVGGNADQSA